MLRCATVPTETAKIDKEGCRVFLQELIGNKMLVPSASVKVFFFFEKKNQL